jgi:hypothetical protein
MLDEIAAKPPIRDQEVRDFIARFPEYSRDQEGWERAKDNVRRLRVIAARKELVARLSAQRGVKFLLRPPVAPAATVEVPAPRRFGAAKSANVLVAMHALGCPECVLGSQIVERILSEHEGRLQLVAGDYFSPMTMASYRHALALRCADEQGNWWSLLLALLHKGASGSIDELTTVAREQKLDASRFAACLSADRYLPDIVENLRLAERVGLEHSVPGLFINGVRVGELGNADKVRAQIDAQLR